MPSLDINFCADSAKCKKRKTCWRHIGADFQEENGMYWWSNFNEETKESGRECKYHIEYISAKRKAS